MMADTIIPKNEYNTQLGKLYKSKWNSYINNVLPLDNQLSCKTAYPFLLVASEQYCSAQFKLMICGQETYGWGDECKNDTNELLRLNLQKIYHEFVNIRTGYNSPYWNFSRRLVNNLGPNVGVIFNNIVKIGKGNEVGCDDTIYKATKEHFDVFLEELEILKPDVILFLTGKHYDWRIKDNIGNFKLEQINPECDVYSVAKLTLDNHPNIYCIRCHHPGFLQRNGLYHSYLQVIIDSLRRKVN